MDLPILKVTTAPSVETLVRYFYQATTNWTAHLAESEALDFGTAWSNPEFTSDVGANCIRDVALPQGISASQAFEVGSEHFAQRGVPCWQWVMNPSAPPEQTAPMVEHLLSRGYRADALDIMYMEHLSPSAIESRDESLKIIPARASFRHAREFYEVGARKRDNPQLADAGMLHLDDPHYDALIALKDGVAVAHVGVLAVGENGLIKQLEVAESFQGQGIGAVMMSRAMEICARSIFKHVFISVTPGNDPAVRLYTKFGFGKIGQWIEYQKID